MNSMEIVKQLYTERIKKCFDGYYKDNFEGEDFDEFKDAFIEEIYNSGNHEDIHDLLPEIYTHLVFFLGIVKENAEEREMDFKDWDKPQKVYELGLYFLANEVLNFASQEDLGLSGVQEEEQEERPVIHRAGGVNWENYHRMVEAGLITPIPLHLREIIHEHLRESSEEESSEEEEETKEPSQ